jgi:ABC-2 type transport system permease protein
MREKLAGTGALVRLALRRDRIVLPAWTAIFVLLAAGSAQASVDLFPDEASRVKAAEAINNAPALVALYGKVYDVTSLGEVSMVKLKGLYAVFLAVLAFFTLIRHTRSNEESGRLELVGAGVVGRYAALTAALLVTCGTAVTIGLLTTLSLSAVGLPVAGSLAFGLGWAAVGCTGAAIAAVAAQVTESARTANGIAATTLGAFYVLRAVGDSTGPEWLSWISPLGWTLQLRPYAGNRWWVLGLFAAFIVLTAATAYLLAGRRDHDAGLVRPRPGPAAAAASLRSPLALAWRLQRGSLLAWAVGLALIGAIFGSSAANLADALDNERMREMITKMGGVESLTDSFFGAVLGMVAVITSAYGVQSALRLRSEETTFRAEPLLATGVSRTSWALSHLLVALFGTALLVTVTGAAAGLAHGAQTGDMGRAFGRVVEAALVQIPAIWVLVAIVAALFGLLPRWSPLAWVLLVAFLLIGEFGSLFELRQSVMDISPYAHVPDLPGGELTLTPLIWLTAIAAALLTVGLTTFRRRDITT